MTRFALYFVLFSLALTACQGATPLPNQTETATLAATSPATATLPATSTPGGKAPTSSESPGCVVQSPFPTPGPTEQSLFPPVSASDWVKGPASATVTFTEYSDFQ